MATWDSADCLSRLQTVTGRPSTDQDLTSTVGYQFLETAQRMVGQIMARHTPWLMYTAPTLMTTADNTVYTFASSDEPIGAIEVYAKLGQPPLREGPYWDPSADYTREGSNTIRITGGVTRTFPDGAPYVRLMKMPGTLDASNAPTLQPQEIREAVVYLAASLWAERGGFRLPDGSPSAYERRANQILWGDPAAGIGGIIPALKQQKDDGPFVTALWWRSPDLV